MVTFRHEDAEFTVTEYPAGIFMLSDTVGIESVLHVLILLQFPELTQLMPDCENNLHCMQIIAKRVKIVFMLFSFYCLIQSNAR